MNTGFAGGWNGGVILAADSGASPVLNVKASGYRISGIIFKPGMVYRFHGGKI